MMTPKLKRLVGRIITNILTVKKKPFTLLSINGKKTTPRLHLILKSKISFKYWIDTLTRTEIHIVNKKKTYKKVALSSQLKALIHPNINHHTYVGVYKHRFLIQIDYNTINEIPIWKPNIHQPTPKIVHSANSKSRSNHSSIKKISSYC